MVFDIHLWISFTPNAAVLFVDVAIQTEVRFIAKQNSLMKIGNNGNLVLGPFDESTPCMMIVLMNCQTKLRINHLTAVKSVAILEMLIVNGGELILNGKHSVSDRLLHFRILNSKGRIHRKVEDVHITADDLAMKHRSLLVNLFYKNDDYALAALKNSRSLKDCDRFNSCQVIYYQFGLAIHQNDHQARHRFVEWAQNEIAVVPDFHKRILFSDEAHFWLNGYVNKQNCRIWSEANPQVYVETQLHPETLTVWCALWAGGIIGSYFFKNDEGHNVTVNGDRYKAMITNFFIPELNNHDVQELWFQQDGATCHTARATIDLLKDTFGDRLISRFGPVNCPPRSCDLIPLDYFLWGYVKSLVYADKPQTLDHLKDNIRRVIVDIRTQMFEKVIESWTSRFDYI
ncbi:uncharacterized protein TNCV_4682791 [Trichonephila clavipes]|nr:uncharacterized protein TNCV_4682791 [Trichonephila clavipes]